MTLNWRFVCVCERCNSIWKLKGGKKRTQNFSILLLNFGVPILMERSLARLNLPCNVILFLSSEIDRNLLLICNALANSLAPMSPIKLPLISGITLMQILNVAGAYLSVVSHSFTRFSSAFTQTFLATLPRSLFALARRCDVVCTHYHLQPVCK